MSFNDPTPLPAPAKMLTSSPILQAPAMYPIPSTFGRGFVFCCTVPSGLIARLWGIHRMFCVESTVVAVVHFLFSLLTPWHFAPPPGHANAAPLAIPRGPAADSQFNPLKRLIGNDAERFVLAFKV